MKAIMSIVTGAAFFIAVFLAFFCYLSITEWTEPESWGSYSLGNNLYLIDFDGGKIVVNGSYIRGKTCYGGEKLVPNQLSGKYAMNNKESIEDTFFDFKWVIVKTKLIPSNNIRYYIINKSFAIDATKEEILNSYIEVYDDNFLFVKKCKKNAIDLSKLEQIQF